MLTNPRPRKYANDAERQKAYRSRNAVVEMRLLPDTVETLDSIALELDTTRAELLNSIVNFALTNRNWRIAGLYGKRLPSAVARKTFEGGYWIDDTYDPGRRVYICVVRDAQSNIVTHPLEVNSRAAVLKLSPIDFQPLA